MFLPLKSILVKRIKDLKIEKQIKIINVCDGSNIYFKEKYNNEFLKLNAISFKEGVLVVNVSSSNHLFFLELRFKEQSIILEINKTLHINVIKKIRFLKF